MRRQNATALVTAALVGVFLALTWVALTAPGRRPADVTTAAPVAREVHFTAVGDFGATPETEDVLAVMDGIGPELNLALGDLSYGEPGGEDEWCQMVVEHVGPEFPFQLLAGNHESDGSDGDIDRFAECLPNRLPEMQGTYAREWYVDLPADDPLVRFVMISPALAFPDEFYVYEPGTPRFQWTEQAIDGARAAGIPWVVVGAHKPCLTVGTYECDPGSALQDMLIAKQVDLVLHGHEHLYQRTHQLALGPQCASVVPNQYDPACVADSDAEVVKGAGTVFATVGTGGVDLREVFPQDPEAGYFATTAGVESGTWGLLDLRVTPTELVAEFVPTPGGTYTDLFTITADETS